MSLDDVSGLSGRARRRSGVLWAVVWMTGALASFTVIAIAGREAAKGVSTGIMMFYRSWFALALILLAVLLSGRGFAQFRTPQLPRHALRGVIHFGAQYSWLYALPLIPLTELFSIEFTAPLWTALIAPFVLRERLTPWRLVAVGLGFAGMLVIVQPGHSEFSTGTMFALFAAVGFAMHYVITKQLMRRDHAFTVIFYMALFQSALGTLLTARGLFLPDTATLLWILVIAVLGLTAHFCIARALSLADAIIVTPMDFLRLPLIAVVGLVLYAEPLNPWVMLGATMIVAANFLNIWSERRSA